MSDQKSRIDHLKDERDKLVYRLELLIQKFSILNEIRLRLAPNVSPETIDDYSNLINNNYGNFFRGIRDSLRLAFYIELRGFIGVSINKADGQIGLNNYDQSTLWQFINSQKLIEKVDLRLKYSELINKHLTSIKMVQEVRHFTAHSKPIEDVYQKYILGYDETTALLNDLGMMLELAGRGIFKVANVPHGLMDNNQVTKEISHIFQRLDFSLTSKETNDKFMIARDDWYKNTSEGS